MSLSFISAILILLVFFHWYKTEKIKEIALTATRRHCQALQLLMLDDYIAFKSFSLQKNKAGRWQIKRCYSFEFASTGEARYNGLVTVLGASIDSFYLEPYRINSDF